MAKVVEILDTKNRSLGEIDVLDSDTINDVKSKIAKISKISIVRQSVRLDSRGKDQSNSSTIQSLNLGSSPKLYVRDLGPQVGWKTVFLAEYAGPIFVYVLVASAGSILYGSNAVRKCTVISNLIYFAWIIHYVKRILETLFVHRFSHVTMPLRNLFKNCTYYWGFTFYVAYHVNHPLWTQPPALLSYFGFALFLICELGNLSIHLLLRDLRPVGSTVRKIPYQNGNILTVLFNFVSCPNYTYEFGAWLGYSLMSGCLPAFIFALAGLYQMTVWALGKHRNYKKEFPNYPKSRKSIIPFII